MKKATLLTLPCLIATLAAPAVSGGEEFLLYTPKPAEADQAPAKPEEGVLVRNITIKRGDTLSGLSQKFLGRGSWFPELLVFNSIKNPDLIYTGATLRVPVPPEQGAAVDKEAAAEQKPATRGKRHHGKRGAAQKQHAAPVAKAKPEAAQPEPPRTAPEASAQGSVEPKAQPKPAAKVTAKAYGKAQGKVAVKGRGKAGTKKPATAESARAAHPVVRQASPVASPESESFRQAKQAYLTGEYQKAMELFSEFLQKYPNSTSSADAALYRADSMMHLSGQ